MLRGTMIAQIIAMIGSIYIAKLYGEEAFGYLSFFIGVSSILSVIYTLQLDKCLVIAKTINESKNWLNFLIVLILIIGIATLCLTYVFSNHYAYSTIQKNILVLSSLASIALSFNIVHENFLTYTKNFSLLSNTKVFLTLCNLLLQIVLYPHFNILGLVYAFIITQLVISIFYFVKNKSYLGSINFPKIKKELIINSSIVKYLFPSNLINTIANYIVPILLLSFFSVEEAGVYFFSIKILGAPLHLISSSVSQVYFQKSSELKNKKNSELLLLTIKVVKYNLLIMGAILLIINTIGIYFLELYFEEQWQNLRCFLLILSFLILARSSFNPISSLIIVLDKNKTGLLFNCYLLIVNLVSIYYGWVVNNIFYTISIVSLFGGIGYFILLLYFLKSLKKADVR